MEKTSSCCTSSSPMDPGRRAIGSDGDNHGSDQHVRRHREGQRPNVVWYRRRQDLEATTHRGRRCRRLLGRRPVRTTRSPPPRALSSKPRRQQRRWAERARQIHRLAELLQECEYERKHKQMAVTKRIATLTIMVGQHRAMYFGGGELHFKAWGARAIHRRRELSGARFLVASTFTEACEWLQSMQAERESAPRPSRCWRSWSPRPSRSGSGAFIWNNSELWDVFPGRCCIGWHHTDFLTYSRIS